MCSWDTDSQADNKRTGEDNVNGWKDGYTNRANIMRYYMYMVGAGPRPKKGTIVI